jgi:hypothetical protein
VPDLYAALNVSRDADRAAIRRAYRKRAKDTHPDGGGTPEKFALVKLAHDTLTDDARRARYDQTGEAEEKPVDNRRASILELISGCLDMALAQLYERSKPPIHCDMVKLTKDVMRELRRKWSSERDELKKNIDRSSELIGRWTAKKENVMEMIAVHRVAYLRSCLGTVEGRIALMDEALAMLDGATFRTDPEPMQERRDGMAYITFANMMNGARW